MHNVAPSGALSRAARQLFTSSVLPIGAGIFSMVLGQTLNTIPLVAPQSSSYAAYRFIASALILIGPVLILIGLGIIVRAFILSRTTDNDLANITAGVLSGNLDDGYTFIRNINKRGLGYVDGVLIGPPGVLVFRIVDEVGNFYNEVDRWLIMNRNQEWVPARIDPTRDAVKDIKAMRDFLAVHKLPDVPVFGVVVFIQNDPPVRLQLKDPVVLATHLSSLYQRLQGNYFAKERIDAATARRLVDVLYDK